VLNRLVDRYEAHNHLVVQDLCRIQRCTIEFSFIFVVYAMRLFSNNFVLKLLKKSGAWFNKKLPANIKEAKTNPNQETPPGSLPLSFRRSSKLFRSNQTNSPKLNDKNNNEYSPQATTAERKLVFCFQNSRQNLICFFTKRST